MNATKIIKELVRLKDIKDAGGQYTHEEKEAAWEAARRFLGSSYQTVCPYVLCGLFIAAVFSLMVALYLCHMFGWFGGAQ